MNIFNKNIKTISILIFLILFLLTIFIKPNFIYNRKGNFRIFGLGKTNSTIIPIWLFVLILAICSYLLVHYFLFL